MNNTTTTLKAFKIGRTVKWKSGAGGTMKLKKGKIIWKIAAGKTLPATKFPTLAKRAAGTAKWDRFIVEVKGKIYCPRTTWLQLA